MHYHPDKAFWTGFAQGFAAPLRFGLLLAENVCQLKRVLKALRARRSLQHVWKRTGGLLAKAMREHEKKGRELH